MNSQFPETFREACKHAAEANPDWYRKFDDADIPSCSTEELHRLADTAPNAYLSGFVAGHALARAGRTD